MKTTLINEAYTLIDRNDLDYILKMKDECDIKYKEKVEKLNQVFQNCLSELK
jgi:hypothetical protein